MSCPETHRCICPSLLHLPLCPHVSLHWCPPHAPSSPLAWAVLLYLRHSGIKLRDSKVFPGISAEKDKWPAFLKTKKVASVCFVCFYINQL